MSEGPPQQGFMRKKSKVITKPQFLSGTLKKYIKMSVKVKMDSVMILNNIKGQKVCTKNKKYMYEYSSVK